MINKVKKHKTTALLVLFTTMLISFACVEENEVEEVVEEEVEEVVEEEVEEVQEEEGEEGEGEEEEGEGEEEEEEEESDYYQGDKLNFPRYLENVTELPTSDSLFIYIMAGQSNMAGRGFVEPEDTIPNNRIITIDESVNWVYAKEPFHFYEPKFTGLDCGMSFARTLLESLPQGVTVAMIPCAVGGSSINKWLNNEEHRDVFLLDNFKNKVAFAQKYGTVKGIIWHQGESNASSSSITTYAGKLTSIVEVFREAVGDDDLPFVAGELGRYTAPEEKQDRWDLLNAEIHGVADADANMAVAGSEGLTDIGDGTHLDSESLRTLGERFAQQYLELIGDDE